jgi:hypothetical protein
MTTLDRAYYRNVQEAAHRKATLLMMSRFISGSTAPPVGFNSRVVTLERLSGACWYAPKLHKKMANSREPL